MFEVIKEIQGQVFDSIIVDGNTIIFKNDFKTVEFHHEKDCCEDVYLESVDGDISLLENKVILAAEKVTNKSPAPDGRESYYGEWTFYKFRTVSDSVTVRWFGESNGYYSTEVTLKETIIKEAIPSLKLEDADLYLKRIEDTKKKWPHLAKELFIYAEAALEQRLLGNIAKASRYEKDARRVLERAKDESPISLYELRPRVRESSIHSLYISDLTGGEDE